jgi:hypothetical protein
MSSFIAAPPVDFVAQRRACRGSLRRPISRLMNLSQADLVVCPWIGHWTRDLVVLDLTVH